MSNIKSFLIINRHSPYQSSITKEALDVALMAAVFNQKTSVLFMDDGVYQLLNNQDPKDIQQKNNAATFPMLEMYDVDAVYVESTSLETRGLKEQDLLMPVQILTGEGVRKLIEQQHVVLNF